MVYHWSAVYKHAIGSSMQNDSLECKSAWLQERICLRTFVHIVQRAEEHTANMGFSSLCLEGSSANCSPRLPTAQHSTIANDGLWQNLLGSKPCGTYRWQLGENERLNYKMFENIVRKRKVRSYFLSPAGDEIYVFNPQTDN